MLNERLSAAKKIASELHEAEDAIDETMIRIAQLAATLPTARRDINMSAIVGQEAMAKVANALAAAGEVRQLLTDAELPTELDEQRPRDHGAWVPLMLMYPDADIPIVQLSLPSHAGPALQVKVGQALRSLREQGVLLVGSGSITHNLGELNWRAGPEVITPWAGEFRDWMVEHLRQDDRVALLDYRRQAPHAVRNHPSDEHLLPLFFALGAGEQFGLVHSGFTYGALGMDVYRFD